MPVPSSLSPARLCVAAVVTVAAFSADAATYTLVDLGPDEFPTQVNARGDVSASNRHGNATVFRGGHWHVLSHRSSAGRAINAFGDVAGDNGANPVLWPRGGASAQMLPLPGGSNFGLGFGINGHREVVGLFEANDATIRCFAWTPEGGSVDLGFMAQGDFCQAFDVNSGGQITGEATVTAERLPHAYIYDHGVFHDLGILAGGDQSTGLAINRNGDVAGRASVPPLDGMHFHAAVWTHGNLIDLDPHSAMDESVATGINGSGEIVGTVVVGGALNQRAVRFTPRGVVYLDDEVKNLDGWTLAQAGGVNDDGAIVGVGYAPDGKAHAFMLRPASAD